MLRRQASTETQEIEQGQHSQNPEALSESDAQHLFAEHGLFRRARRPLHNVRILFFHLENYGAGGVDDQFQKGDVHGEKDERMIRQHGRNERHPGDRNVQRKNVDKGLAQVVVNAAAHAHGADDRGKIVVGEHDRGSFAGDVGTALAHGNPYVGGFEGGRVVHTVAGHGDDLVVGFEGLHDAQFLLRNHAREDRNVARPVPQHFVAHAGQFGAADDVFQMAQADLFPDGAGRSDVIAGDHDDADPGAITFLHGQRHRFTDGIGQSDQTEKTERETSLFLRQGVRSGFCGGHGQDAQTVIRHARHLIHHRVAGGKIQFTEPDHRFRRAFHRYGQLGIAAVFPDIGHGAQLVAERIFLYQAEFAGFSIKVLIGFFQS